MKSIQIILLMCINLREKFPSGIKTSDVVSNIVPLLDKGLIELDVHDKHIGYIITCKDDEVIMGLYTAYDSLSKA